MTHLGWMHDVGRGVPQHAEEALVWYRKAAELGHETALNNIGVMYKYGRGVEASDETAAEWYRKAAEQGYASAQFNLAESYKYGTGVEKDYVEAVAWYRRAAGQGHADAEQALGHMYLEGDGVEQSDVVAAAWYLKAAKQGLLVAQNSYGWMLENGHGVERNEAEAVMWFRKSADQGNSVAQFNLGSMYLHGKGVEQDNAEMMRLLKVAKQVSLDAHNLLGWAYGSGRGVKRNDEKAVWHYRIAAEGGHKRAQFSLGTMYYDGRGIEQSDTEALSWFRKAAEQGDSLAQNNLAWMYDLGRGVEQSDQEAYEWRLKSALQECKEAQFVIGSLYELGHVVEQNDHEALYWYRKATEQDDTDAKFHIKWIEFKNRWISEDEVYVMSLFRREAKHENAALMFVLGLRSPICIIIAMSLQLGKCLREGDYGAVYIGLWHGQRCAVKRFYRHDQYQNIQREISVVKNLRHRHIIQFLSAESYEGSLVMITDFADGGSLKTAIDNKRLGEGWSKKEEIAKEIAKGLAYIHANKITHGRLNSSNVLLTQHLEVKLCDFGLAQIKIDTASCQSHSQRLDESMLRWMAPEILARPPKYSTKSDMYAFGMVMWEMAADCTTPFYEKADNDMFADAVLQGEREVVPKETPKDFKSWIGQCWEQEPSKRPEAVEIFNETIDDVGFTSSGQESVVDISLDLSMDMWSQLSVTGMPDAPGKDSGSTQTSDGNSNDTVIDRSNLPVDLGALNGEYAERIMDILSMFDGVQELPRPVVEELELMVIPVDQLLWGANNSDSEAQYQLGRKFLQALGVEADNERATQLLEKAALQGHSEAQFHLAQLFLFGSKSAMDKVNGHNWLQKVASQGHAGADTLEYTLRMDQSEADAETLAEIMKTLCERDARGDVIASMSLGGRYSKGTSTEDLDKARRYFERAIAHGHAGSATLLGLMYQNGQGVPIDLAKAHQLYTYAASRWDSDGQFRLGMMFKDGKGVSCDEDKAFMLLLRSAEQGNRSSLAALQEMN
ncbi:hypothetical protein BGZ73_006996 [Actinomortierella ambigua]|nr:hypothetical protein BGZ73_006996 [Actinomortierella ambigua]